MKRPVRQLLSIIALLPIVAGCKYDRSFMQMDSNSGSPFFGLQLAVDSGSRPPKASDSKNTPQSSGQNGHNRPTPFEAYDDAYDAGRSGIMRANTGERSANQGNAALELTSRSSQFHSPIRFSLPFNPAGRAMTAETVDLRRAAF